MKNFESFGEEKIIDRFWTIPNVISLLRLIFVPFIVVAMAEDTHASNLSAFALICFAYCSDFLDGFVARLTGQVSRFGKVIDPFCDKVIAVSLAIALFATHKMPLHYFLVIVIRDALIGAGSIVAMVGKNKLPLPLIWGKISTFLFGFVIAFYPLRDALDKVKTAPWLFRSVSGIVTYGTYLSEFFIILSFSLYFISYFQNVAGAQKSN